MNIGHWLVDGWGFTLFLTFVLWNWHSFRRKLKQTFLFLLTTYLHTFFFDYIPCYETNLFMPAIRIACRGQANWCLNGHQMMWWLKKQTLSRDKRTQGLVSTRNFLSKCKPRGSLNNHHIFYWMLEYKTHTLLLSLITYYNLIITPILQMIK